MTLPGKWGLILLAAWLIAMGLVPLLNIAEPLLSKGLHILAVAAGVLILMDRAVQCFTLGRWLVVSHFSGV